MKNHLSLYVSNLVASADFYTRFLGVEPVKIKADYAKFELLDSGLVLSLVQNPERVNAGFGHVGFVVESADAVQAWQTQAEQRGVQIALIEQQTRCCYALQDKFWVHDPDGVQWEVDAFHEDSEWNDPEFSSQVVKEQAHAVCCSQ